MCQRGGSSVDVSCVAISRLAGLPTVVSQLIEVSTSICR